VLTGLFVVTALVSGLQTPYGPAFFSDHFTHMNAARLFPRVGLGLWRTPIDQMFPLADASRRALAPPDVQSVGHIREVPGWPDDKPFVGSWTHIARPYPPGDLVIVAPIAILYHFTPLSFAVACHLLIVLFLAFAHAAFAVAWKKAPRTARGLYAAAAVASYGYVIYWTLNGFYDAVAMIPLLGCAAYLDEKKWLAALVAFSAALFLQFRALYYVPWALYAAVHVLRDGGWRAWTRREWVALVVASALSATALFTFVLVRPAFAQLPFANPIHPGGLKTLPVGAFVAALASAAIVFARSRAHLDLAVLCWMTILLVSVRQTQAWHAILFVPWVLASAACARVRLARIAFVVVVTTAVIL
jgi:hypothetical protein